MKRKKALCIALALLFFIAACSSPATSDEADSSSAGSDLGYDPDAILNIMVDVEPSSLDPQRATDAVSLQLVANLQETLYKLDADDKPVPGLAESYEISDDGLTWTFKIKQGLVWSNGDPLVAGDFVYAWRRAVDPETKSDYAYIVETAGLKNAGDIFAGTAPVDSLGVSAPDDYTLVCELAFPVPYFLSIIMFPTFTPANEAFIAQAGDKFFSSPEYAISSGAFLLTDYTAMSVSMDLVKNPNYWDADNVHLGGIHYQVIKDSQQALLSYQNGDIDFVTLHGEQAEAYANDPDYVPFTTGPLWWVSPNVTVAGLDNLNLRMALALSFDKAAICDNILRDGSIPADFVVPWKFAYDASGVDFRETAGTYLSTDKEKAKEYYEAAKAELGVESFDYELLCEDTESVLLVAQFIKSEIETNLPGVTINILSMPKATRLERMYRSDYELGLTRWGPDYADPMTYLDLWQTGAQNNYGLWSNAEYDAIIDSCKYGELANKLEERWAELVKAEMMLLEDAALFPAYQLGQAYLVKPNVKGIAFHALGGTTYTYAEKSAAE